MEIFEQCENVETLLKKHCLYHQAANKRVNKWLTAQPKYMKLINNVKIWAVATAALLTITVTQGASTVPAKARTAGKVEFAQYIANPTTPEGQPILNVPFLYMTGSGNGHATHLGRYKMTFVQYGHFAVIDGQLKTVLEGTWQATTANGDTMHGTLRHEMLYGEDTFVGDAYILGGTGRFAGVTGYETTVGYIVRSPDLLHDFYYEHDGWMTSVGVSKKNQ